MRDPKNGCKTLLPHQYLRVNTIFEVVKAGGGRTAWTDKHPSYEWTNGPSGKGVNDFYGPEINSIPIALPQFAGCAPVPYPDPTPDDGWTTSFQNIQCYDSIHVQAVINQIDGFNHDRTAKVGVPTLFGTNFQSVSVGEKLAVDPVTGVKGGYTDVLGTPGARHWRANSTSSITRSGASSGNSRTQRLVRFDTDHHQREARSIPDRCHEATRNRWRSADGDHRHGRRV